MSHIKPTLAGRSMRSQHISAGTACILLPVAAGCTAEGEPTPPWNASSSADRACSVGPTVNVTTATDGTLELQLTIMQMLGLEVNEFGSRDKTIPEIMG